MRSPRHWGAPRAQEDPQSEGRVRGDHYADRENNALLAVTRDLTIALTLRWLPAKVGRRDNAKGRRSPLRSALPPGPFHPRSSPRGALA
jgi:hypothetical protein